MSTEETKVEEQNAVSSTNGEVQAVPALPEATVKFDAQIIKDLSFSVYKKLSYWALPSGAVIVILASVLMALSDKNFWFALISILIGALLIIWVVVVFISIPIMSKKSPSVKHNQVDRYVFGDKISESTQSDILEAKDIIYDWSAVIKAVEYKKYFFLFISNIQAFTIPKENLKNITVDGFRALLKEKLGKRYKGK